MRRSEVLRDICIGIMLGLVLMVIVTVVLGAMGIPTWKAT